MRNLLIDPGYLNNPIAQKNLDAMINKRTEQLFIEADYMVKAEAVLMLFRYTVKLEKDISGKFTISYECLSSKKATSKSESMETIFEVTDGEIVTISEKAEEDEFSARIANKTMNLLATASMSALFYEKFLLPEMKNLEEHKEIIWADLCVLYFWGKKLHVYLDEPDDHRSYVAKSSLEGYDDYDDKEKYKGEIDTLLNSLMEMNND